MTVVVVVAPGSKNKAFNGWKPQLRYSLNDNDVLKSVCKIP